MRPSSRNLSLRLTGCSPTSGTYGAQEVGTRGPYVQHGGPRGDNQRTCALRALEALSLSLTLPLTPNVKLGLQPVAVDRRLPTRARLLGLGLGLGLVLGLG